jgi:hypothetical protein
MYDYYLGGKDNFAADREAAEKVLSVVPDGRAIARANRKFLARAVSMLARRGIRQFIDLGTGIPTSPNVHEVARSITPGARVAYIDNDPIVFVHSRAVLPADDGVASIMGDIRYPNELLASRQLRKVVDFGEPVGVIFTAVLHFLTEEQNPQDSVTAFRKNIAPGSYLIISHISSDGTAPEAVRTIENAYHDASAPAVFRTWDQIEAFFDGFDVVHPGIVDVSRWRRAGRQPAFPPALCFLGGVGKKPDRPILPAIQ